MNRSSTVRFAVVGYGHIGKRHAAMIRQHPSAELVAVCDVRTAEAIGLPSEIPHFTSLEQMLATVPEIDVINICTPNGYHAVQSLEALEARKHVVVEKPMALRRTDCERVIHKALNVSRQVFCVMQNRYSPAAAWVKEIVSEGKLGDVLQVQVHCFWNRDDRYYFIDGERHPWHGDKELDGGVLFTQFAHFVDILYWVFGDIENIESRFANYTHSHSTEFPDSGQVQFDFVNGGMGTLAFSTSVWDRNFESSLTVVGTRGSFRLGGQYMNEITHCHIEGVELPDLPPAGPPNDYGGYTGSAAVLSPF
jgi:UDP-N-acetyl-2-amino-2-deoxyglucuronate dehydrogenase